MSPIDQSRPFPQRLDDFGPELGAFLGRVWQKRTSINVQDFEAGVDAIYDLYSGAERALRHSASGLRRFLEKLLEISGSYAVHPQGLPAPLADYRPSHIRTYSRDLWRTFFHVLYTRNPAKDIRSRVYVHAADADASLALMKVVIDQFGVNQGLWEAKTAGPGSQRLDTIVCYLYDGASADALVRTLAETAAKHPELFADSLPPLVKRAGPGIGVADEPPAIEIYREGGTRHSFGSFFSTLCWIALETTPNVAMPNADGRHMLDNLLFSLRALRVDPRNPQRFPEASSLEAWYQAAKVG